MSLLWSGLCLSSDCIAATLPHLTVVTELSPPNQTYDNGVVGGTSTELVKQIVSKASLDADYHLYPWARAFKVASERKNTLIYSMAKTPLREQNFHWIGPVARFELGFVTNSYRQDVKIEALEDAKKYRLAVQRGDIAAEKLEQFGFDYVLTADIERSYQLLVTNKVDLVLDDPRYIQPMTDALNLPKDHFRFVFSVPNLSVSGYLAANIDTSDEVINKLRLAFEDVKRTELYKLVLSGYH
ncbi:transporter substrate-binding domain-containing protein [Pseudoalteromonas sp. MMG022]|uniref:Amino acid ABC transporter substrate-binding protein n=2 Tax=Pseudoalteromonas TaxID=53246 RepID=A0A1S1MXQ4_9GAMM|nr:transporter substrate-binding domain-containing protein [Pseudoalteromonas sp. MMG022]MCF6437729.1 transporter substrate-binding domain-containing protein [Pseudoalteromonas sp. MMG022]OHU85164.1 amino acid ABC transporter substrate-binding protein [Pseudoalteromonas sp. JW3]OHU90177.1 amino acid ABC transporter substrate-binding protein [Pseudoalteromonas amylolytica]